MGTTIRVTHDGLTVVSTVEEIGANLVPGGWLMHHQTCWSHYLRHSDAKGSYWTKTLWCANNTTKFLTWKEVTGDIDAVNWPWTAYDDHVETTAGGVGHNYHEDTGRGKFRYCPPVQGCVNVLDITKIWKEQYGDGVTDSDFSYESESL